MRGPDVNVTIDWDVFLESGRMIDALIEFVEERTNHAAFLASCRSEACRREACRMRVLGNYKSREQARRFLQKHYTWE